MAEEQANRNKTGQIAGQDIVDFDKKRIQLDIPKHLNHQLMEVAGVLGFSKSEIIKIALAQYVSSPGVVAMTEKWQRHKAQQYDTTVALIRAKVFGCYKDAAEKSNLNKHRAEQ